jgi:hypothetical protein
MSSFARLRVSTPHRFEIARNGRGYWVAKDKQGLIGGVFRTQKHALRFALFEVGATASMFKSFLLIVLRPTKLNNRSDRRR